MDARDNELKTPLHYAVLGGHEAIMQSLLNHGAQVNAADISGQTALHKASAQGQLRFVQELIARGADVNARLQASDFTFPILQAQGLQARDTNASSHVNAWVPSKSQKVLLKN